MRHFLLRLLPFVLASTLGVAQVNVLTANGDKERTNSNLQETQLNPGSVLPGLFGELGSLPVDGQVYAQVLYVTGLSIPNQGTHNVVFVSTMHNSVYAYNVDSIAPATLLWHVTLGPSVPSNLLYSGLADFSPEVGILSTGTIDLQRGVLYVVSETLQAGVPSSLLHALDLTSGAEKLNGPITIKAIVPGTGAGALANQTVPFDSRQHIQRPGLLVANGAVYISFGSHADLSPWHGWLISYDASDLSRQTGAFLVTASGEGGAIWQSGRGLAADDAGNVYAITGNGDYDGVQNFSETFLRVSGSAATLTDWYTPVGWQSLSENDGDLSAGPALIAGTHLLLGADKYGNFYFLDTDSMGHLSDADTYYGVAQAYIFNFAVWSRSGDAYVYVQGQDDFVRCFAVTDGVLNTTPISSSSISFDSSRVGMTLSANGTRDGTGVLWETTSPGTLHAFDASDLTQELWNSDLNGSQHSLGSFVKFVNPTV